jgi:hypothetical protein
MKFLSIATLAVLATAATAKPMQDWNLGKYISHVRIKNSKLGFMNEKDFFENVLISFKNVGDNSTWYTVESGPNVTTSRFWASNVQEKEGLIASKLPMDARTGSPFILTLGGWAKELWVPKKYSKHSVEYVSLDMRNETFMAKDVPYKWNKADMSASYGVYMKNGAPYANCWTVDTMSIISEKKVDVAMDVKYVADGILRDDNENARLIKWW